MPSERNVTSTPEPFDRRALLAVGGAFGLASTLSACRSDGSPALDGAPRERGDASRARDDADRRAELFAHVKDQRASVSPISASDRSTRRARAAQILAGLDVGALLVEPGPTMTYLTGISWGHSERLFALVMLADGTHAWICPAFEESKARLSIDAADGPGGTVVTWQEDVHPFVPLAAFLREHKVDRLAIEPQVRSGFVDRLADVFGRERIVPGHAAVLALRARKDQHEIAILRRANELTKSAIREVAATLSPGLDGAEISARLDAVHEKMGMRSPWCLALIGPAAALPHGDAAAAPLAKGDVLLIDTGASLHGYQSDISRTWTFGAPPSDR
jgi:Xaa-Pro dipeptidase